MKHSLLQEIHEFTVWGEHVNNFEYLASGKDGDVYTRDDLVIKVFKDDGISRDDGMKLQRLENSIYYPDVKIFTNDFMVSERIYGNTFYELVGHNDELRKKYKNEIQLAVLDAQKAGLEAFDLHNHNLILTNDGEVRIVDVGRFGLEDSTVQFGIFSKLFGRSSSHKHHKHRRHVYHSSSSHHHKKHRDHRKFSFSFSRSYSRSYSS